MAQTSEDRNQHQTQLLDRKDRICKEIRIWDVLNELGIDGSEDSKGKIHCIFPSHSEKTPSMKVYVETDSVYCFGCNGSGDVVEVARRCAGDGKAWPLERAIEWLEQRFDLAPLPKIVTFTDRLKSKLVKWKGETASAEIISPLRLANSITDQMLDLSEGVNPEIRVQLIPIEDYIWNEFERPGVNHVEWYSWASKLLAGYYNRFIQTMADFLDSTDYREGSIWAQLEIELLADDHLAADKAGSP